MTKEVFFDKYCKSCKNEARSEDEYPCSLCLQNPSNEDSHRPVCWIEKEK